MEVSDKKILNLIRSKLRIDNNCELYMNSFDVYQEDNNFDFRYDINSGVFTLVMMFKMGKRLKKTRGLDKLVE